MNNSINNLIIRKDKEKKSLRKEDYVKAYNTLEKIKEELPNQKEFIGQKYINKLEKKILLLKPEEIYNINKANPHIIASKIIRNKEPELSDKIRLKKLY